ncbi:hypothetical protein MTP99_005237 [Tenebrio molitor]|jgi:hypothetical protein|nr:hypothetical protein MTP99_005237 [Tenebrio molitor]
MSGRWCGSGSAPCIIPKLPIFQQPASRPMNNINRLTRARLQIHIVSISQKYTIDPRSRRPPLPKTTEKAELRIVKFRERLIRRSEMGEDREEEEDERRQTGVSIRGPDLLHSAPLHCPGSIEVLATLRTTGTASRLRGAHQTPSTL